MVLRRPDAEGAAGVRPERKADAPELPAVGSRLVLPDDGGRASVVEVSAGPPGTAWRLVPRPGGGWVALVRLPESADGGVGELVLSVWGLPRDDDELAKGLKANGK